MDPPPPPQDYTSRPHPPPPPSVAVHRRRRGCPPAPLPPPPPPLLMFEADNQNFASAPSVPRGSTLQKVLARLWRGPQGDPGRRGGPSQPPPPPLLLHPVVDWHVAPSQGPMAYVGTVTSPRRSLAPTHVGPQTTADAACPFLSPSTPHPPGCNLWCAPLIPSVRALRIPGARLPRALHGSLCHCHTPTRPFPSAVVSEDRPTVTYNKTHVGVLSPQGLPRPVPAPPPPPPQQPAVCSAGGGGC